MSFCSPSALMQTSLLVCMESNQVLTVCNQGHQRRLMETQLSLNFTYLLPDLELEVGIGGWNYHQLPPPLQK